MHIIMDKLSVKSYIREIIETTTIIKEFCSKLFEIVSCKSINGDWRELSINWMDWENEWIIKSI